MLSYLLTETTILLKHMLELAFLVGSVCLIVHPQVVFIGQREGPNSDNIYIFCYKNRGLVSSIRCFGNSQTVLYLVTEVVDNSII